MKIDEYLAKVLKRQEDWVRHVIDMSTLGDDDRFAGWLNDYFRVVVKKEKNGYTLNQIIMAVKRHNR